MTECPNCGNTIPAQFSTDGLFWFCGCGRQNLTGKAIEKLEAERFNCDYLRFRKTAA